MNIYGRENFMHDDNNNGFTSFFYHVPTCTDIFISEKLSSINERQCHQLNVEQFSKTSLNVNL